MEGHGREMELSLELQERAMAMIGRETEFSLATFGAHGCKWKGVLLHLCHPC